jgi:hypothetical protein
MGLRLYGIALDPIWVVSKGSSSSFILANSLMSEQICRKYYWRKTMHLDKNIFTTLIFVHISPWMTNLCVQFALTSVWY